MLKEKINHLNNILNSRIKNNSIWILGFDMTNDTEVLIKKLRNYNVKIIGLLDAWKGLFRFWKLNEKLKLMPDFF